MTWLSIGVIIEEILSVNGVGMSKETYFEASIYGIGQLITQRKMFTVPEHQRNFAWTSDDIDTFFSDITAAVDRQDADYFVGLVVLLGPKDDRWIILDGQQRLATTTMIYSAMRNWLSSRSLEQDSLQINSEFISVRMLGGGYQPRFLPNLANRQIFIETIMDKCPDAEIRLRADNTSKYSSNRLLLDGNLTIRERLQSYVSNGYNSMEEQTRRLFGLANYLETRVRVVALDVSSEANAFMIFES